MSWLTNFRSKHGLNNLSLASPLLGIHVPDLSFLVFYLSPLLFAIVCFIIMNLVATSACGVVFLAGRAQALTSFQPTCTLPNTTVHFVASAGIRGTFDILWSCIFTIIACTWSIQHLNVPEQRDRSKETSERWGAGFWYDTVWSLKRTWTGFKWMMVTILAPEFILGKAIGDLITARNLTKDLQHRAKEEGVEWDLVHSFFLLMGGFRLESSDKEIPDLPSLTHRRDVNPSPNLTRAWPSHRDPAILVLTPRSFKSLLSESVITQLPKISGDEIRDKSKSNLFVKVVAVVQVIWVTIQVIARTIRGLSVSQLELVVTAFSACAVLTYILLIPKPQGVEIPAPSILVPVSQWNAVKIRYDALVNLNLRVAFFPGLDGRKNTTLGRTKLANDAICVLGYRENLRYAVGISASGVLFGAIHVAGWNFDFPTSIDRMLWRVSSVLIVVLLPPSLLPFAWHALSSSFDLYNVTDKREFIAQAVALLCGIAYVLARLVILVETFRSLAYMLREAYLSTWAENVPHFG